MTLQLLSKFMLKKRLIFPWLTTALLLLTACSEDKSFSYSPTFSDKAPAGEVQYLFGIHPLHNPQRLHEVFGPVMEYLSSNIKGVKFQLEASRNYASYDKKLYAKRFHFSLPNPFQTINAIDKGYRVFAKMGDDQNFRGIIITRKDSHINSVSDLKGKAISYPAPTALAATMMPQYYLQSNGLNVMRDVSNKYVGSQESSIMNVFHGATAAGSTWPPPWHALIKERKELTEQLEVKWETEPLLNNGLVVLPEVPQQTVDQVTKLLTNLHKTKQGKIMLRRMELSRFEVATNETYQPVRDFIKKFAKEVRPVQ